MLFYQMKSQKILTRQIPLKVYLFCGLTGNSVMTALAVK